MNARQFYNLVRQMRAAQKNYFRTRDKSYLEAAKKIEKEIDAEIARVEEIEFERQNPKLL